MISNPDNAICMGQCRTVLHRELGYFAPSCYHKTDEYGKQPLIAINMASVETLFSNKIPLEDTLN
jgi:hypothetical protein